MKTYGTTFHKIIIKISLETISCGVTCMEHSKRQILIIIHDIPALIEEGIIGRSL
jgi:hypothetical protein